MKTYSSSQLSALARLFSASVFKEMARKGQSNLFTELIKRSGVIENIRCNQTVGDAFNVAFKTLKILGNRDEYVYRTAITQKVLMGRHSLRTASVLNEFRAGNSKADIVILNGTATAYEIKSERDSLVRLSRQLSNYRKVFARVNVIASEGHIDSVLKVAPNDVGIMCLSKRYQIKTVRKALECPSRICPVTAFESLRSAESMAILQSMGITVPEVPNTQRHTMMRNLFATLDPVSLHAEMVQTLKKTRNLAPLAGFIDGLPKSLQAAALSISVRRSDHSNLLNAIATPMHEAMTWS